MSTSLNLVIEDLGPEFDCKGPIEHLRQPVDFDYPIAILELRGLVSILAIKRPARSAHEERFVKDFLDALDGMHSDAHGNRYIIVGDSPTILFSCHTDTVHQVSGLQEVHCDHDNRLLQSNGEDCLGADDGAGVWLMLEMIRAGVTGAYLFHRDEEVGGQGSKWLASNRPDLLSAIDHAIAFDHKGTDSVVTVQRFRTCSDRFAQALCQRLGMGHKLSRRGVFTDTANYIGLVPECTNISVGYFDNHTRHEQLDYQYLFQLRDRLLSMNWNDLPIGPCFT